MCNREPANRDGLGPVAGYQGPAGQTGQREDRCCCCALDGLGARTVFEHLRRTGARANGTLPHFQIPSFAALHKAVVGARRDVQRETVTRGDCGGRWGYRGTALVCFSDLCHGRRDEDNCHQRQHDDK